MNDIVNSSALQCHNQIIYLQSAIQGAFLELGEKLYEMESQRYYSDFEYDSFREYVEGDLVVGYRTARRLVDVYAKFILEYNYDTVSLIEAGYSKLDIVRTHVTNDNLEELIASAKTLSRDDLKIYINEQYGDKPLKPQINWEFIADLLYSGNGKPEYAEAKKRMNEWRDHV